MRKAYSLDYSIERDTDRVAAIYEILDGLEKDPNPTDLEQMASYILYGKDENGQNSIHRHETTDDGQRRYNTFARASEKVMSLDELLDNPLFDHEQMKSPHKRDPYKKPVRTIHRPKYDKKTGELKDIGDADIPGMVELWDSIDRIDRWIMQLEGKIPPDEDTLLFDDSYRLYRLKHSLVDLRRTQYDLLDSYKPCLHFQNLDHPKTQFYHLDSDSFYWVSREQWEKKVHDSYSHKVSRDIKDYEVRTNELGETEVKWVVYRHNFDWKNPKHIQAFMTYYSDLKLQVWDKLDTYSKTLFWDFDRYRKLAGFSEIKNFMIDLKIQKVPYEEIIEQVEWVYGITFHLNHLSTVFSSEIPKKIARVAEKLEKEVTVPEEEKIECARCKKKFPRDPLFFSYNRARKTGFARYCKDCEKLIRIEKGVVAKHDKREKVPQVQTRKTD